MEGNWNSKLAAVSRLIYKINSISDANERDERFFDSLGMFIEYDAADLYRYNAKKKIYKICTALNYPAKEEMKREELGLNASIIKKNVDFVYRESDYQDEQSAKNRTYLHELYKKNQFAFALHIILAYDGRQMGVINLYRYIGNHDFNYEDLAFMNIIKEHLSLRMFSDQKENAEEKCTVSEAVDKYNLTPRETQVLKYLLAGKDNYQISDEMRISVFTIKKHTMNVYRKLNISSRTQLFKKVKEFE